MAFREFLQLETHFDLVDRRGYTWDNSRWIFTDKTGLKLFVEGHFEARNRVMDAFVRKAVGFFLEWKGINPPEGSNDNRKLVFSSLADYLVQSD